MRRFDDDSGPAMFLTDDSPWRRVPTAHLAAREWPSERGENPFGRKHHYIGIVWAKYTRYSGLS